MQQTFQVKQHKAGSERCVAARRFAGAVQDVGVDLSVARGDGGVLCCASERRAHIADQRCVRCVARAVARLAHLRRPKVRPDIVGVVAKLKRHHLAHRAGAGGSAGRAEERTLGTRPNRPTGVNKCDKEKREDRRRKGRRRVRRETKGRRRVRREKKGEKREESAAKGEREKKAQQRGKGRRK